MNDSVYAVVAYIARYWFAFLMVIILWRAILWLRKDASRTARVLSKLPDAGFIGEWAVLTSDHEAIEPGTILSAPRDGWIGSARPCDVRLKSPQVPAKAARFYLRKDGLHLLPRLHAVVEVDGETVRREAVLRHGATLSVGGITLQLRLFAGVLLTGETPARKTGPSVEPYTIEEGAAPDEGQGLSVGYGEAEGGAYDAPAPIANDTPVRTVLPTPTLTIKKRSDRRKSSGTRTSKT